MFDPKRIILVSSFLLWASTTAGAQSGKVSLKPVLKQGEEARYLINAIVDTNVTPTGSNGIASNVHKETTATVVLRAVASEKGGITNEAVIEAIEARTSVDGIDGPPTGRTPLVGLKIEYQLDPLGRLMKASFPQKTADTGLAELLFSLTRWVPVGEVTVGQTWGNGTGSESLSGDYGYIAATNISEIVTGARISYTLSGIQADSALVQGVISLNQSGAAQLTTKQGLLSVNVIAAGKGSSRVEYDIAASRIISATTETSLEGRLSNIPPAAKGAKLQQREGSVVETAKFSIKLVK